MFNIRKDRPANGLEKELDCGLDETPLGDLKLDFGESADVDDIYGSTGKTDARDPTDAAEDVINSFHTEVGAYDTVLPGDNPGTSRREPEEVIDLTPGYSEPVPQALPGDKLGTVHSEFLDEVPSDDQPVQNVVSDQRTFSDVPVQAPELDAVVGRMRSEINDAIITTMHDVTVHNEEFFKRQVQEAEKRVSENEQRQVVELAKLFEKFILTNNYCSGLDDRDAILARYRKFEKDFERAFSHLGIETGSVNLDDDALDPAVDDKIDIQFEKKADEDRWNRISELRDAHYYVYKGQVVKRQVVGIYRDQDRS